MKILYAILFISLLAPILTFAADDPMVSLFKFQTKMAQMGNTEAMMKLGFMYEEGQGTQQDWDKALEIYRQAQSKGDPGAENAIQRVEQMKQQRLKTIKNNAALENETRQKLIHDQEANKARIEKERAARQQQAAQNKLVQEQAAKLREEKRIAEMKKLRQSRIKARPAQEEIPGYDN